MVTLKNGDILRFLCSFQHKGAAWSGAKLYAAIGQKDTFFNEVQGMNGTTIITGIKDDPDWVTYQNTVDVPISNIGGTGGAVPGSMYEAYVKLISIPGADIFWYGPLNDITLEAPIGVAEFRNLAVSYQKA